MDWEVFRRWSEKAADWGADYRASLRDRPVRAQTAPGEIAAHIADSPPEAGEAMEDIFKDFEDILVPGMTHWQHPRFFAYFPANAAPVSVIAEYLVSVIAAQCMLWQTSPSATELETKVVDWLRQGLGLPDSFTGVIQDSASTATLAAVLVMRERVLDWQGNSQGLAANKAVRIYSTDQVHTSIDRAIWISGIGAENLVRIRSGGPNSAMDTQALAAAIERDRAAGLLPAGVIACVGGTSTGACDDIAAVVEVARRYGLYVHVDAAWAGSAMICPEFRESYGRVSRRPIPSSSIRTNGLAPSSIARSSSSASQNPWCARWRSIRNICVPMATTASSIIRMVGAARPSLPCAEALVPAALSRARRLADDDPQPRRLVADAG